MDELHNRVSFEWQNTFDALVESVLILDVNRVVVRANRAAYELLAEGDGELVGKKCYQVFSCDSTQCKECLVTIVRHTGESITLDHGYSFHEKTLRLSCAPRIVQGQLVGFIHTAVDITPQHSLEKQLVQAQKIKAISTLAGGIAHDFNNILGVILGNADLLLYRLEGSFSLPGAASKPISHEEIKPHLQAISKAGLRAQDLVSQILTFSRQASSSRRNFLLGPMVKEAVKFLKSSLPSTITLKSNIADNVSYILADPTQMYQVVMNLCTNAVEAIDTRHGVITITLEEQKISEVDADNASKKVKNGEYVVLTVQDTGEGMSEEVLERIYDPFFSTREVGEGNGLGLAVLHGIVSAHDAIIDVRSSPGIGSTFTVYFPKINSMDDNSESTAETLMPGGSETIIFADDEESIVQMYSEMLEYLGYTVITASSGKEVLEYLHTHPDSVDLVITDQTMPLMTGLELAFEIKKIAGSLPIILSSGYTDSELELTGKEAGVTTFLAKPFDMKNLAAAIRKIFQAGSKI